MVCIVSINSTEFMQGKTTIHQAEVQKFLQTEFGIRQWDFSQPYGWCKESYFASGDDQTYFIKLGAPVANYEAMASVSLTPPVIAKGLLEDGTPLLVQPYIDGCKPSWADFRLHLEQVAWMIQAMQHSAAVRRVLPDAFSNSYRLLGLHALRHLRLRFENHKASVPTIAGWVDERLDHLGQQIESLDGSGTLAVHNDICNANWIITPDGKLFIIDLDAMSMDDPAVDLGAILWWYYPPELRQCFLEIAGIDYDQPLRNRMRLRMSLHCLEILLPREHSFDHFDADNFEAHLEDFKAILAGEENPQGYG